MSENKSFNGAQSSSSSYIGDCFFRKISLCLRGDFLQVLLIKRKIGRDFSADLYKLSLTLMIHITDYCQLEQSIKKHGWRTRFKWDRRVFEFIN
jgi:hypothetical protein